MKLTHYTAAQLEAAIPVESHALGMVRRALYQWSQATDRANAMNEQAARHPDDERIARCAALLEREVITFAGIAGRAVRAWVGERAEPIYIRDLREDPTVLRFVPGADPRPQVCRPGTADYPEAEPALDLGALEQDLGRRVIVALIEAPEHRARCLARFAEHVRGSDWDHHLGTGAHSPATMAELVILLELGP